MPTVEVLSDMQWNGMYVDKEELEQFGKRINIKIRNNNKNYIRNGRRRI